MFRTTMLSLALLLALMPVNLVERIRASQSDGQSNEESDVATAVMQLCSQYDAFFIEASNRYNIPINMLRAIALVESGC